MKRTYLITKNCKSPIRSNSQKSFTNILKKSGRSIEPYGTPIDSLLLNYKNYYQNLFVCSHASR